MLRQGVKTVAAGVSTLLKQRTIAVTAPTTLEWILEKYFGLKRSCTGLVRPRMAVATAWVVDPTHNTNGSRNTSRKKV